jgi:hypothetical protein
MFKLMMAGLSLLASREASNSTQSISPEIKEPTFTHCIRYILAILGIE